MNFSNVIGKTLLTLLVAVGAGGFTSVASAQSSLPSSKATFAYSSVMRLNGHNEWQTVLKQQIKMANQKDLFMNPSLQCGLVTDTTVKSMNGSLDSAEARGTIRVRIKVTGPDGSVRYAAPTSGVDATGATDSANAGVVYCDRIQTLAAKFSGLNCTADLTTGAVTCASPEELQLILKTLNANAFNFVAANLSSGVHTVEVQAKSSVATSTSGANGSLASANAFVGAGSVAVEAVRMIKGNDGTTLEF